VDHRLFIPLLIATLIALPVRARAPTTPMGEPPRLRPRRRPIRGGGGARRWQEAGKPHVLTTGSVLRFLDESGRLVEITAAALARAAERKSVLRPEDLRKIALAAR